MLQDTEWDLYHQKLLSPIQQTYFLNNDLSLLGLDLDCGLNEIPSQGLFQLYFLCSLLLEGCPFYSIYVRLEDLAVTTSAALYLGTGCFCIVSTSLHRAECKNV